MSPYGTAAPLDRARRFAALDGLRGVAVLLVLLDHASDAELRLFPAANMNRAGKYGVYLFFVLSAFLLTHLSLCRPDAELLRARTWLNYAVRRFLRIFPLYLIVLVTLVALHKLKFHDVQTHLLLLDGKRQFWSIPVEVKYYFLLPFLLVALGGARAGKWLWAALGVAGALAAGYLVYSLERRLSVHPAVYLFSNLEPFLLGTAAAFVHRALHRHAATVTRFAPWFEGAGLAAILLTVLRIPSVYNGVFRVAHPIGKFAYDPLTCGILWTVTLLGVIHGTGYLRRGLETAPLRYLGLISFSVYLWHIKFLTDVDDMPIPLPLRLLVFVGLVVAVSSVSYFLVERPLSRIRFDRAGLHAGEPTLPAPLPKTMETG